LKKKVSHTMPIEQNDKTLVLRTESGASVEIYWFGATVTSWKVDGKEKFFLSSKSCLDASKPIRGGIPIVFPIFGAPPSSPPEYASLSQHGFARTMNWTLDHIVMDRPEGVSVRLLSPPPPPEFKHDYRLSYVVTLAKHQLSTDLHIVNTSKTEDFKFQALLHNYLAVPDVKKIQVHGLDEGVEYVDKIQNFKREKWAGGALSVKEAVDRVFENVPSKEIKVDDGAGSGYNIRFREFTDCTIWNPQEGGKNIADMEDDGWNKYICIEPGYVHDFKVLKPGEEFLAQQVISII